MRYLLVLLGWALLAAPSYATQQEKQSIHQILDNFIASAVAYNKCGANDQNLKSKFAANLMEISIRDAMSAREEHPDQSSEALAKASEEHLNAIQSKVAGLIGQNGCNSDGVKQLLKMYEFHANWNMYASPNR